MIKGDKITLVSATLSERQKVYEWCFHSETTKSHAGPPDYPDICIPSAEEFFDDYEDYYFDGSRPEDGRGFFIVSNGEQVGFISYSAFHVKPGIAELDNWISSEANCGKGYGTDAIVTLGNYLHETMGIHTLIMGPSIKNKRAIRAYEKAGLFKTDLPMSEFLLDEFVSVYGDGDYGEGQTAVCVKRFEPIIPLGVYRHYKGNQYEVIGIARHSETLEDMVVYKALYGDRGTWVRPLSMWGNTIEINGKTTKRFEYVGKKK